MTFDDLLQVDLKEEDERRREQEAIRLANEDLPLDGTCPECQHISGGLQIGHTMFNFCCKHRCYWRAGRSWKDFKDEQRAKWNEIGLDHFKEVKGWVNGMRRAAENS
jgi:hypothetical protein